MIPVSYTHLDVYKRQVLIRMIQALCDILPHNKGLKSLFRQVYIEDRVVELSLIHI